MVAVQDSSSAVVRRVIGRFLLTFLGLSATAARLSRGPDERALPRRLETRRTLGAPGEKNGIVIRPFRRRRCAQTAQNVYEVAR